MSDIIIYGMEMPRRREEVFLFAVDCDGKVYGWNSEELPRLKAIAIPDHGRLIDADALHYNRIRIAHADGLIGGYNAVVMSAEIKDAPTIIPASEEMENGQI